MSIVYPKVGGIINATHLGSFAWASRPSATAHAGATIYVTNIGCGGGGSYWYSDGVRWRAKGGRVTLLSRTTNTATAAAAEEIMEQCSALPLAAWQTGDVLRLRSACQKSSNAATTTVRVRVGSLGTTGDTEAFSLAAPSTTNTNAPNLIELVRVNATTVRRCGQIAVSPYQQLTGTYPADITVTDLDTIAAYISLTYSNTGSETTTSKYCTMELIT